MKPNNFIAILDTKVQGIPCKIGVEYYSHTPAYMNGTSNGFYSHTEVDFTVLDSKGYVANWLASKMTEDDNAHVEELVTKYFNN